MPAARRRGWHAGGAGPAQVLLWKCQSRSQSGCSARSTMLGRAACGMGSPALPPAQAKGSVRAGRGAWQTPAQGTLEGTVLGPLPSPGHRPSIFERGCSSSQALPVPQCWPYPAGVSARSLLWPTGLRAGRGFFAYSSGEPCPGVLGEGPGLLYQCLLSGPCRSLGRATWRRLRRCTHRCTQQGKR